MLIRDIEINPQFKRAHDLMEHSNDNIFITGKAGTGKSTLLEYFRSITGKNLVVLAPTGVAAVNINGQTIHSFFGFRPDTTIDKVKKEAKKNALPIYRNLDMIIIDEVSMVRSDLLDCVDEFLRINGKVPGLPFGGTQMVFIGDLYQIPPVVVGQERAIFREHYNSEYFFAANAYREIEVEHLELEKIYRQTDQSFIELLNKIRNKTVTIEDIEAINMRVVSNNVLPEDLIFLTTTNAMAEERNEAELLKIAEEPHIFRAETSGGIDRKSFPADEVLQIKTGAQVMLLNNDSEGRWINGTIGVINEVRHDCLEIGLTDGRVEEVKPYKWNLSRFFWDEEKWSVASEKVGSFKQYPLKLAWAITIHKSQGKTFDNVAIDLGRGAFAPGQLYVALSRCRNLNGIFLKRKIRESDIRVDFRVVKFLTGHQYELSDIRMPLDEKVALIREAVEKEALVEIIYLSAKDEKTRRVIRPESVDEMSYKGKDFTGVKAYCLKRKELRTFRVDRILGLSEVTGGEVV